MGALAGCSGQIGIMNPESIPLQGDSSGPLSHYIERYITQTKEEGYAAPSVHEQVCVLKILDRWLERTGREVRGLDEAVAKIFLRCVIKRHWPHNAAAATLRRMLAMLRRLGVVPAVEAAQSTPSEQLTRAYECFLLEERNLSRQSVAGPCRFVSRFLSGKFGAGSLNLSKLTAPDVSKFVQRHARLHSPAYAKILVGAMRSFLRYLHYKGLVGYDLSFAVPKVARWSLSTLPKYLSAAQVQQVLHHCDRSTPRGRRNYAILLLLARLGLRAGEVVGLNLEDIDWDNGRITVCGKGGKWAQLPMPTDVAGALAHYLRRDRPRCACRSVFIRDRAPTRGFLRATAIACIVKRALAKAGVVSARKGAHLLRHSLATDMLRKGASLDEIGEVLRHKSPDTTAIYAKVDLNSLQSLALPWPGGAR